MTAMIVATAVAGISAASAALEDNGSLIFQPPRGFGVAYGIGEDVWEGEANKASYALLTFVSTIATNLEAFGPDINGKLESLGMLGAGWVVTSGDIGSKDGHVRRLPR